MAANHSFVPLILGTDFNAYGIARTLADCFNVHSHLYDVRRLPGTRWSSLVDIHLMDRELRPAHLADTMVKVAKRFSDQGMTPVLYACGDDYARIVTRHYQLLSQEMIVPYEDAANLMVINHKSAFYRLCHSLHLPSPRFVEILDGDRSVLDPLPFDFPVVIKPDDNVAWHQVDFPNYRKVFKANNAAELNRALDVLDRYYDGSILVQEYIPGRDSAMYVVNGYVAKNGHLAMLSLGHCLLDDPNPVAVGNYLAILPESDPVIYDSVEQLINHLQLHGFLNIDLKFDARDGQFKFLDFNPRQGRSSYYTSLAGTPLAAYPIADYIDNRLEKVDSPVLANDQPTDRRLWLNVTPDVFARYAPTCAAKQRALAMIKAGRYGSMLRNSRDVNLLRRLVIRQTEKRFRAEFRSLRAEVQP